MFKRHSQFFLSLRVALDAIVVLGSFALAYAVRFRLGIPYEELPLRQDTIFLAAASAVVWPLMMHAFDIYTPQRYKSGVTEVFGVFKATIVGTLVLVALTYFTREHRYSRGMILAFAALSFVNVSVMRLLFKEGLRAIRRRGYNLRYIVVVGTGDLARRVVQTIRDQRELGVRAVGALSLQREERPDVAGVPILGTLDDLPRVIRERQVDQVIIALPVEHLGQHMKELMETLSQETVDVKIVPDLFQYVTLSGGLEQFGGLPVINLQTGPMQGWNLVLKRLFDVCVASVILLLAAPLMLLIALAVKLSSPGPVFYAQERMGMDGRIFRMLKFRSMRTDAEADGARMTMPGDPRRTRIGAFLRKTSLDELPQLWNVLKGDMSLVGPRPERPVFIEEYRRRIPRYHLRHKVKSGMTGWAQVNGLRGQTSIEKRIEYDLYYIENWSLGLDLRILARTALGGFLSRNAY